MDPRNRRASPQAREPEPVRITSAGSALSDDIAARSRRYLLQMGIRVLCFIGAVVVDHPIRWALLAGAIVLPYVAVLLANAWRERPVDPGTLIDDHPPLIESAEDDEP